MFVSFSFLFSLRFASFRFVYFVLFLGMAKLQQLLAVVKKMLAESKFEGVDQKDVDKLPLIATIIERYTCVLSSLLSLSSFRLVPLSFSPSPLSSLMYVFVFRDFGGLKIQLKPTRRNMVDGVDVCEQALFICMCYMCVCCWRVCGVVVLLLSSFVFSAFVFSCFFF